MAANERILLVEDEPLIAMMLEDVLEELDRRVAGTADTVAAALRMVEQDGFDAAILDVNLRGGEKSWPVADALAAAGKPFLLATGGGDDVSADHRGRPVLHKPFTMESVRLALDSLS